MLDAIAPIWNVILVLLGFGLVIVVHEAGHFLAARWAGIRVFAFAVGFGPAVCSWRKGMGFRRGSSEDEYRKALEADAKAADARYSPTEYRLNWVPLGGYVRMLGQEDLAPATEETADDSYQAKPVWKRMVVISAGVVMNIILAAVLFVGVYLVGLPAEAPAVDVPDQSPSHAAGLRTGDVVRRVNGNTVEVFQDIVLEVGLAKAGRDIEVVADRVLDSGKRETVTAIVEPEYNPRAQIRVIGVSPMLTGVLVDPVEEGRTTFEATLARAGLEELGPRDRLVEVDGEAVEPVDVGRWGALPLLTPLYDAVERSNGEPMTLAFESPAGKTKRVTWCPEPRYMTALTGSGNDVRGVQHLLGLTSPMMVEAAQERGEEQGLRAGDVFARLGSGRWPSVDVGVDVIRDHAGDTLEAVVVRDGVLLPLTLDVSSAGTVGFFPGPANNTTFLADTPDLHEMLDGEREPIDTAAERLSPRLGAGMHIVAVNGEPLASMDELWRELRAFAVATPIASLTEDALTWELEVMALEPGSLDKGPVQTIQWRLTKEDLAVVRELGWSLGVLETVFEYASVLVKGEGPVDALALGLRETKRMLARVYLTLTRLADGSVKPQQLKGPVGITHIGSQVAEQGFIKLLFFLGLLSANLAVLNFLPLPIVDGGHFIMLAYEGVTGKPVPIVVQNFLMIIGLLMIAGVFLFVTFNDLVALFS